MYVFFSIFYAHASVFNLFTRAGYICIYFSHIWSGSKDTFLRGSRFLYFLFFSLMLKFSGLILFLHDDCSNITQTPQLHMLF